MKTSKWILTLITAAVLLTGCAGGTQRAVVSEPPSVDADGIPRPTLAPVVAGKTVAADGELVSPYPTVALGFGGGVSGRLLTVTVRSGDTVQAGDLLAILDDTDLQRDVEQAQLALDRAIADREQALVQWEGDVADAEKALADAERALTTARLNYSDTSVEEARVNLKWAQKSESDRKDEYEKAQVSWPPRPVDAQRDAWHRAIDEREMAEKRLADAENAYRADYLELQALEADVVKAERDLAALQAGIEPSYDRAIEDAEAELAKAQEALGHAQLTAPWEADVLSVDAAPGATVGADKPVVTLLNVEEGLRFVTQNLSEQHIANIYPGQRAVVTLRTFADTPLEGTVEAVVPQVDGEEKADARFTVRVRLAPADPSSASGQSLRLLPGLTGRVEIHTGE